MSLKKFLILLQAKIALGFILVGVGGCDFRPLYAPSLSPVADKIHNVKIALIEDRSGQILRNALITLLNPYGPPSHPNVVLSVKLQETKSDLSYRRDATARRTQLQINVKASLKNILTQKIVWQNEFHEVSGFSIGSQADFASFPAIVSEDDTREKLLLAIAEQLKVRLASFFASQSHENS